jgi:hypothetical protein
LFSADVAKYSHKFYCFFYISKLVANQQTSYNARGELSYWNSSCLNFEANFMNFIMKILQICKKSQIHPNPMIHAILSIDVLKVAVNWPNVHTTSLKF